ncbi:hypothetical protein MBA34_24170, partial [Pseudomonas capeferrum]|nr:hypothetical protein [Pseudomonas capeferrum]
MTAVTQQTSVSNHTSGRRIGLCLCLLSMFIFAAQDGITKVLVKDLPIAQLALYEKFCGSGGAAIRLVPRWSAKRSCTRYQMVSKKPRTQALL